jgi:acyl carrier protein
MKLSKSPLKTVHQPEHRVVDSAWRKGHPRPKMSSAYVAPTSEMEHALVAIWQQLLGIEKIGVHDNFFELGGHSLLAVQIMFRLRQDYDVNLAVGRFLKEASVACLAELVEQERNRQPMDTRELASALEMVEAISDDEAKRLLAQEP